MTGASLDRILLAGRVAVVSGAAGGGVGTAASLLLAARGAAVVVNGTAAQASILAELAAQIEDAGGRASVVTGDVGINEDVEAIFDRARERFGGIDIVVHNAAPSLPALAIHRVELDHWAQEVRTILGGGFNLTRVAAPWMIEQGWGRIVYVSSSAARRGTFGRSASYAAAKAALLGLARQVAIELGPHGVTTNVVSPSQLDSPRSRRGGRRNHETMRRRGFEIPLGRVGTPDDVAQAIAFLASDAAAYITGTDLIVDGGSQLATGATRTGGHDDTTEREADREDER